MSEINRTMSRTENCINTECQHYDADYYKNCGECIIESCTDWWRPIDKDALLSECKKAIDEAIDWEDINCAKIQAVLVDISRKLTEAISRQ